jgi:hypothetical protein
MQQCKYTDLFKIVPKKMEPNLRFEEYIVDPSLKVLGFITMRLGSTLHS